MPAKLLPADALEALRQRLHTLPPRSPERHQMIHATAATYGVSGTTVYRALQVRTSLRVVHRVDRGSSRVLPKDAISPLRRRFGCWKTMVSRPQPGSSVPPSVYSNGVRSIGT